MQSEKAANVPSKNSQTTWSPTYLVPVGIAVAAGISGLVSYIMMLFQASHGTASDLDIDTRLKTQFVPIIITCFVLFGIGYFVWFVNKPTISLYSLFALSYFSFILSMLAVAFSLTQVTVAPLK